MSISMDGHTSFIGTEFIKLLNTGTSDLATEEYVDNAVANGGGGGNVDLSNYYTQTETDNLLNNKLNVNNPQDIIGTLRIDSTNGNGKLIVNAVGAPNASDDFYCNGNGHFNGTLRASVLTSDGDVNAHGVNADTFNSNVIANDIIFKHNDIEYMRFNVDDTTIDFSTDLDLQTSELVCNNFNSSDLNDVVFKIIADEYLRFKISDNTVRVPNTRSFLSQNIFTDIVKPLAFSNDVVFNGGNSTNDAYEEYVRLDASAEKVNIRKETKFENAIQLNQGQSIKWTNVFIREVQGATRPEFDLIVNGSTSHLRLWVNGAIKQAITNTTIACKVNIDAEQGLTVFTGKELKTNTINSHTNSNLVIQRSGSTYMTFQSNRTDIDQPLHLANSLIIDLADKLTMAPSLEGGINIFDMRNIHPVVDNPMILFRCGVGAGETIICQMTNDGISAQRNVIVGTAYELRTNAIDTTTDNDLVISRNNIPFLTLDKFTEDTVEKEAIMCSKQLRANGQFRINKRKINQITTGLNNFADVRLEDNNSRMRFFVGDPNDVNLQIIKTDTLNEILLNRNTKCSQTFHTNTIDTYTDTDLLIKRSGTDVINIFTYSPTNGPSIIVDAQSDCGISSSWLFAKTFANRTGDTDTEFRGAIAGGLSSGKVYMKYLHATETLDFDCIIDNTGQNVIGNLINTAVSDKRLKTNIQDIDANCSDCVKNVKLKTFEFKDKKYHNQDKYGMIAQDLLEHLPKEFKGIVRENKPKKDEDKEYLSIDYMKLSVVLWGALQEEMNKREHIESRLFELEDIVKEIRGKGKGESKPKAKAKAKSKNVD